MTNKKNNNELVSDDDPTSELETVKFQQDRQSRKILPLAAEDHTHNLPEHDDKNERTISKLQFDIEQLSAKCRGLEAEIKAREEITNRLHAKIDGMKDVLRRKDEQLKSRDKYVDSLEADIRERDEEHRRVASELREKLEDARKSSQSIPGPPPSKDPDPLATDGNTRLLKTEEYADLLRRKIQDMLVDHEKLERARASLNTLLVESIERNRQLRSDLAAAKEARDGLLRQIMSLEDKHAEEIRRVRFELGEAQDTVSQTEQLNSQLASDLFDTRSFKEELERMLSENDDRSRERIEELESELEKTQHLAREMEEKLEARSDAIHVLLTELARKPGQMDSISDIGDFISDIDVRISNRFDEPRDKFVFSQRRDGRVTQMLVGKVGDKLLRFPLFKNRLTVGRSDDNEIQLNAAYISRRHAVLQTDGDVTRIIDWGSKNGVYVNSIRIKEHFLKSGDIVSIGGAHFRYEERPKRDN
jgi:chromosome segregation ATPase